jgi:hypothetical protein
LPAAGSCRAILVAATAFLAGKGREGVDRRAGAGIKAVAGLVLSAAPHVPGSSGTFGHR